MGAFTFFSTNTKKMSDPAPKTRLAITRKWAHPRVEDERKPYISAAKPNVAIDAPSQSTVPESGFRDSGTCQREMTRARAAKGTLIKKIQCHETCSINHPPRTGPKAVVMVVKPAQVPIALPRDCSSKHELIIARLPGTSAAAAMP